MMLSRVGSLDTTCAIFPIAIRKRSAFLTLAILRDLPGLFIIAILAFLVVLVILPYHRRIPALHVNHPGDRTAKLNITRKISNGSSRTGVISADIMVLTRTDGYPARP